MIRLIFPDLLRSSLDIRRQSLRKYDFIVSLRRRGEKGRIGDRGNQDMQNKEKQGIYEKEDREIKNKNKKLKFVKFLSSPLSVSKLFY